MNSGSLAPTRVRMRFPHVERESLSVLDGRGICGWVVCWMVCGSLVAAFILDGMEVNLGDDVE